MDFYGHLGLNFESYLLLPKTSLHLIGDSLHYYVAAAWERKKCQPHSLMNGFCWYISSLSKTIDYVISDVQGLAQSPQALEA